MKQLTICNLTISYWVYAPVVFLLWVSILFFFKKMLFLKIRSFAKHTKTQLDDIFLDAVNFPLSILILFSGALILQRISPLGEKIQISSTFSNIFKALAVIAIILFLDKFLKSLIEVYSKKIEILKTSKGIVKGTVRVVIIGLGLLIILDSFGISITPILASLGIGSLAIALALQPTLENFFSGIQLVADKPIQLGQFIKLETGEEGYVEKIGWRSTWIKMLPNNMVIIPNKMLVNSRILNYNHPTTETIITVETGVHYKSDLGFVEKITEEVAQKIMNTVQGGVPAFKPLVRFHNFNSSSIDFTVILQAKQFTDSGLIKHEFIKKLNERYKKEGIVIPYPIQAINTKQEE